MSLKQYVIFYISYFNAWNDLQSKLFVFLSRDCKLDFFSNFSPYVIIDEIQKNKTFIYLSADNLPAFGYIIDSFHYDFAYW